MAEPDNLLDLLAAELTLDALLRTLVSIAGEYRLVDHWQQGEFHHDVVLAVSSPRVPASYLVVATNCNGGVKEVLAFDELPDRWALWSWRCPDNEEFGGHLPPMLGVSRTSHWFNPCELLTPDARSELKPEHRRRARGGGWEYDGG